MLDQKEKVYLIVLVISAIILIFVTLYFTYNCPNCDETYSVKEKQPIVVYKIG